MSPPSADSTAFIDNVAIAPVVDTILDGGFEQPPLVANAFATDPSGSAWQFTGTAGVAHNGSDFTTNWTEAQNAPAGAGGLHPRLGQHEPDHVPGRRHLPTLLPGPQRAIYQTHYQQIEVEVDGAPAGAFDPVNTLFGVYQSLTFTVATGPHTITFLGLDPLGGDNTAFIDQVTLSANAIQDGSFESPALSAGADQFAPFGTPWQFSPTAGVARNSSNITAGAPNAPNGYQVGFLEGNGSMTQSANLVAGSYYISFEAAQRTGHWGQQIKVLVDGAPSRFDHALQQQLQPLRDVDVHGCGRAAHDSIHRHERIRQYHDRLG